MGDGGANESGRKSHEPMWKTRIVRKIQVLRKEADIMKSFLDGKLKRGEAYAYFNSVMRKYSVDGSRDRVSACFFKVKNKISAMAGKIKTYDMKRKVKEQNELFQKDKKKFYRSVFEDSKVISKPPSSQEIRDFWEEQMWGDADKYAGDGEWLDELKKNYRNVKEQVWTGVSEIEVKNQLANSINWKAPGHDGISNYWLKSLPCLHACLARGLNQCVEQPEQLPAWVTQGRTTLLAKSNNTSDASQFRPITCLTTMWKCLTGILSE